MLELAVTFNRSLNRLTAAEQAMAKQIVFDYMADPTRPSLALHRVDRARDKRFWTIRASRDLRVVVLKDGLRSVFCYVGHHDDTYKWVEGRRFEVHPITGAAQIIELVEIVREEIRVISRETPRPGVLANEKPEFLLSVGVPESFVDLVRNLDEDGLLELLPHLPEEAQEALLELAAGNRPAHATIIAPNIAGDPFAHPDAQRRFWVASDEEALAQALAKPWAEWLVFLHPSQRTAVERNFNGPARASGAAGTGKSVVAMHRAAHLARGSQGGRVLLTTFSKTLASRLSEGMDNLLGRDTEARTRVEVTHLHAYAHDHASRLGRLTIAEERTIDRLIGESRSSLDERFDTAFLRAEWDEIIDFWGISSFDSYRDVTRTGRGAALSPQARRRIWDVFAEVRRGLAALHQHTFGDICDLLRERIESNNARPFHYVVVDEAQDLGPRELRLAAALASPGPRALFFAGDVGQRIFRWPFSWLGAGIDVRGRSIRLKVNYRTSAEIRVFSDRLLPMRSTDVDGEAEDRNALSLLRGPEPEIKSAIDVAEEIDLLANWLGRIRERCISPREIAMFARTRNALEERAVPALARFGLVGSWLSPDQQNEGSSVTLAALHAAKGLEFRAVAVVACDDTHLPLQTAVDSVKEPDAKKIIEERELSLLYVGCTRARDQLLVTWSGKPSRFLGKLR
jgi:hypothetical protein